MDSQSIEFSEEEIQEELARLGYRNVPEEKLREFKKDLQRLIRQERSKNSSFNTSGSSHPGADAVDTSASSAHGSVRRERIPLEEVSDQGYLDHRTHVYSHRGIGKENNYGVEPILKRPVTVHSTKGRDDTFRDDVSETDSERRMVKRKTLRKNDKGSKFIDESMTESDAGSIIDANERLQRLALRDSDDIALIRRPHSAPADAPYRLSPDDPRPASVILRTADHPHTRNIRKSDPVARYQQFQQAWQTQKAPGEKGHKGLRWNIREQMLVHETIEKRPQRVFVANKYVVPTEKKRQTLRWQIRMDLAHGNKPACGFFHEY
ncbi:LOW QUALITY PROTEIN: hydrolethalus syndrome protein 1 homolog [Haliotis rubra]|uniref:LOW QUALITY PROTEIN: hydrolethalus syndrome protein 1 homolog n=1 Tax=Haliotis rubra TaxID=36100 RepID=UPI001EE611A9|nr:LOW QUALITY PROTEIN: hydrolethalus syndrome protein 1 homolog [Haliotis rubra]